MLGAVADEDPARCRLDTQFRHPFGAGGAVTVRSAFGPEADQGRQVWSGRKVSQGGGKAFAPIPGRRQVEAEIDQPAFIARGIGKGGLGGAGLTRLADEGATADLTVNEAAAFGLGIGAADGADGNAEPIGEVTVSRQAVSRRQAAVGNVIGKGIGDRLIARALAIVDLWKPNCHGYINPIDT